jgi:methylthioribose-1-phosphate isomerase
VLREARPTAVNLARAVDRACAADDALAEARAIEAEETAASDAMAAHGAELLKGVHRVLTHCNTGALAAPGRGTALAVIAELHARHGLQRVTVTESRPLLQGARLTTYELRRLGIPHELIVDSAAAGLIAAQHFDAVILGADRVAANGDVANKVGTYGLALAARAAGIPFVVVAPTTTVDLETPHGGAIAIEEREADEITRHAPAPPGTACRNPAFDITPAPYVTALVTEHGVARELRPESLQQLVDSRGARLSAANRRSPLPRSPAPAPGAGR